jgi:beta-phosphoglucomutase-like phosphatase (HAD superfamily)
MTIDEFEENQMAPSLAAVFFAVDGVLIDSLPQHLQICRDKAAELGLDLNGIVQIVCGDEDVGIEQIEHGGPTWNVRRIGRRCSIEVPRFSASRPALGLPSSV